MRLGRSLFQFFGIVLLLGLLWLFFFVSRSVLEENANANLKYIPKEANLAFRLDGRELAESTLFSIFLDTKDEEVISLMTDMARKRTKQTGKSNNFGLDYLSDIVIFQMPFKQGKVTGFSFNILNRSLFLKNIPPVLDKNSVYIANDEVGIILNYSSETSKKILKSELNQLATRLIQHPNDEVASNYIAHHAHSRFIELYTNSDKKEAFKNSNFLFELKGQEMLIKGSMEMNDELKNYSSRIQQRIEPKGLHLTSSIFPKDFNDSLSKMMGIFNIEFPEIKGISMNYHGAKVINHSSGFFVVPQIELVLTMQREFSIEKFLSNPDLMAYMDCSVEGNVLRIQKEQLYFKQLTPTSFYLGINPSPKFIKQDVNQILELSGSLKPLTTIKGGGLMTAFLEMMPAYKSSKNLAERTDLVHFSLRKTSSSRVKAQGKLTFSQGFSPMNELMRFVLVSEITESPGRIVP